MPVREEIFIFLFFFSSLAHGMKDHMLKIHFTCSNKPPHICSMTVLVNVYGQQLGVCDVWNLIIIMSTSYSFYWKTKFEWMHSTFA